MRKRLWGVMGRKKNEDAQSGEVNITVAQRTPRAATLLRAECERSDGEHVAMRVRNLSETGFGGHCDLVVDFADDEAVKIHFPHMSPVKAVIKWYAGKEAGVQFKQPLDLKRIAEARKAAAAAPMVHVLQASAEGFWQDAPELAIPVAKPKAPAKPVEVAAWLPPALKFGKRKAG